MRVGSDDNWICIERVEPPETVSAYRFTAAATGFGWRFAASGEQVLLCVSNGIVDDFIDFAALKSHRIELALSDGGWLLIRRNIKGFLILRYRVGCRNVGAALQGELMVEPEAAQAFYNDFKALLCKQQAQ